MKAAFILAIAVLATGLPPSTFAHKGQRHDESSDSQANKGQRNDARVETKRRLSQINSTYLRDIKPTFLKKCFDCHGTATRLPWYSRIPGPKHLIQHDIRTAKKHMDMTGDFPFGGHGTPLEDLESLAAVIKDGSMPPLRYRFMHWGSKLVADEVKRIQKWIDMGRKLLKAPAKGESQ